MRALALLAVVACSKGPPPPRVEAPRDAAIDAAIDAAPFDAIEEPAWLHSFDVNPEDVFTEVTITATPEKDHVVYGTPGVNGIDRASVEQVFKAAKDKLMGCYKKNRKSYRVRPTNVRYLIDIDDEGKVTAVELRTNDDRDVSEILRTCTLDVVKSLRFDRGKSRVTFPVLFWPADGGDAGDPYPRDPPNDPL